MPGKTDNADADYYIPRRPIHSSTRVCVYVGLSACGCVPRVGVYACADGHACTYVYGHVRNFSRGYVYTLRMRALSQQLETGVNILHLTSMFTFSCTLRYYPSARCSTDASILSIVNARAKQQGVIRGRYQFM